MIAIPVVELSKSLARSLYAGHPWVYREHVPPHFSAPRGSWVKIQSGRFTAFALFDPESALALRIYSRTRVPDAEWIAERVRAALRLRELMGVTAHASAYRWIAGEGDGLGGLTVDRYGAYAVVGVDGEALESLVPWLVEALRKSAPLLGVLRRRRGAAHDKIEALWGRAPPRDLVVEEHGLRFRANLYEGQKTGLFLDQRDNRRFVETVSTDKRVLNLFGYTGAFSVYAARGGATSVTTVDVAEDAIADARENFGLNGFDADAHDFNAADVFDYLKEAGARSASFDVVVSDPPSFARSRAQRERAVEAYTRLHSAALSVVAAGGLYCASSCTTQIGVDAFRATLASGASKIGHSLQIVHDAGHAADHPVLAGHPEGRYLKFIVARVLPHA
ncbi:MAG TPA: class I SAM-dependent rRNA methyltransferase [Polyangiaceae bacterium]|nr:class I SAM-dependent rRNA methyltransferase [Polyangiaceae bacterium]